MTQTKTRVLDVDLAMFLLNEEERIADSCSTGANSSKLQDSANSRSYFSTCSEFSLQLSVELAFDWWWL